MSLNNECVPTFSPVTSLIFWQQMLFKVWLPKQCHFNARIQHKWYLDSMGTHGQPRALCNSILWYLCLCLSQNECIIYRPYQVIFLISSMRTTLFLSSNLACSQRRIQFNDVLLGGWPAAFVTLLLLAASLSASFCSRASCQFNLTQFSFNWPVSLQYWQDNSGSREPSIPGTSCWGCGFSR